MLRKTIILAALSFILGVGLTYGYTRLEIKKNKDITSRIASNVLESLQASQENVEACSGAYKVVADCFTNIDVCNMKEEAKKLTTLNNQRKESEVRMSQATHEAQQIIAEMQK